MTINELRYNALVLMVANLQRLVVFHNSQAHVAGAQADEDVLGSVTRHLDLLAGVVQRSDESRGVSHEDVEAVRPVADLLAREVRPSYATDLDGPLRTQAAFGAGAVYAAAYLTQGTIRMAEVFDHPEWADRARQHVATLTTLQRQAQTAVGSSAQGEPSEEAAGFIRHHAGVAVGDRELALSQVDAIPEMLSGRDPLS